MIFPFVFRLKTPNMFVVSILTFSFRYITRIVDKLRGCDPELHSWMFGLTTSSSAWRGAWTCDEWHCSRWWPIPWHDHQTRQECYFGCAHGSVSFNSSGASGQVGQDNIVSVWSWSCEHCDQWCQISWIPHIGHCYQKYSGIQGLWHAFSQQPDFQEWKSW